MNDIYWNTTVQIIWLWTRPAVELKMHILKAEFGNKLGRKISELLKFDEVKEANGRPK